MQQIKRVWNMVSYEVVITGFFMLRFIMGRSTTLVHWASAWNAMDYSMGTGSRLLIGSIYRLFYGEFLDIMTAYKYTARGVEITILVLAITLGQMIRIGSAKFPEYKNMIIGTVIIYMASPWSVAYVWNWQNFGRFDGYMLLVGILAVLTALLVKNVYVRFLLFTVLGVLGLAIHQGFAFLYYPMVLIVMCYDVFYDNRVHTKNLIMAVISGCINVAVAVYFQFFSSLRFNTVEEVVADIATRTDIAFSDWAIEIEYFGGMEEQLEKITPAFFQNDAPWTHMMLILLLFIPILWLYVIVWKDVFHYLKEQHILIFRSPYFYVLLTHLCYVPMFLIHTDWGRHFAPLMALPSFIFLFYLDKGEAAMVYAYQRMKDRVVRYPMYFVLAIAWIAFFDSFGAKNPFQNQAEMLYQFLNR